MKSGFEVEIDEFTRYRVGIAAEFYDPAQKKVRRMLYLVAYDICEPKRLRKVAKTCEDYGIRVEYSVFECDLSEENFKALWDELNRIIDADEDSILAYRICGACIEKIASMGNVVRLGKIFMYII